MNNRTKVPWQAYNRKSSEAMNLLMYFSSTWFPKSFLTNIMNFPDKNL